ncbi:MAG: hypothetical protein K0U54_07460 [Bacteroidetes bacterium]|nr:hypothetical protein [Bacteroidota bacterium]
MQQRSKYVFILMLLFLIRVDAQQDVAIKEVETMYTQEQLAQIMTNGKVYDEWVGALQEPGVKVEGDQMIFSSEAQRLLSNEAYRNVVYKSEYTFEDVKTSIANAEIQKSFWQMIRLYPEHQEVVLQYIYAYDKAVPSDKVVSAAFYTYAFFDPEITEIKDGKPNVIRPDIFEEYLRRTREIVGYINYFRKEEKKNKS